MAAVSYSTFKLTLTGFDPPPGDYAQGITGSDSISKQLADGNADDQINRISRTVTTISASGSTTIDLQAADRYGAAHAASDCAMIYLYNAGSGDLRIRPSSVSPWNNVLAALPGGTDTPEIKLYSGMGILLFGFAAGTIPVAAGNRQLDVVEVGGVNPATLTVHYWTRA